MNKQVINKASTTYLVPYTPQAGMWQFYGDLSH